MATVVRGLVEGIGITEVLPENPNFFTEVTIPETICLPEQKPDMEQILSVITPYIEDIYARMINKRCIFKNIAILVDVTFPGVLP